MILLDGNEVSSLEIDLSVTSAGTGGIGAPLPARLGLRRQRWRSNPSRRQGLNYPLKRVKVESNYTQLAAGGPFRRCPPVTMAQKKQKPGSVCLGHRRPEPPQPSALLTRQQKVTKVFQSSFGRSRQRDFRRQQKGVKRNEARVLILVAKTILFRDSVRSLNSSLSSSAFVEPSQLPSLLVLPDGFFLSRAGRTEGLFSLLFLCASQCVCVLVGVILA